MRERLTTYLYALTRREAQSAAPPKIEEALNGGDPPPDLGAYWAQTAAQSRLQLVTAGPWPAKQNSP